MPSLSGKGIIAVKNPESADEGTCFLSNFLRSKKNKHVSLIDIIFLICQSPEPLENPLIFEMDQLICLRSQIPQLQDDANSRANKRVVYAVNCERVSFCGVEKSFTQNVVSFKDISTKENL